MRIAVLALAASVVLAAGGFRVDAGEVDDRAARAEALGHKIDRLGVERQTLAQAYERKVAAIAELKAQPSAWGRDRKLQGLLAESQTMAAALDGKDAELRAAAGALAAEKRALLGAIDAELAADPPAPAERRDRLGRQRASLVAELSRPIRIADERIDPADDADDLELKAGALAQSEKALVAETERLDRRAVTFHRQAKLVRSRNRADEQDVFREEERVPGRSAVAATGGRDTNPGAPPTGTPVTNVGGADARAVDVAADPSLVLSDVLAANTIDELRRAERSGDPETLARSAELARRQVAERAARVRERRLEMLRRAQMLRGAGQ